MKNDIKILRLSLLLFVGISTMAQAEQHLCPSPESIKNTIKSNMMRYDDYSITGIVEYAGKFDTSEMWQLQLTVFGKYTRKETWDFFQESFSKAYNASLYAVKNNYTWDCKYQFPQNKPGVYGQIGGFVTLKTDHSRVHLCPTAAALKQRLKDKNVMTYEFSPSKMGVPYFYYGKVQLTDNFNTNDQWYYELRIIPVTSEDEAWTLFQNYLNSLPEGVQEARDEGYYWSCFDSFDDNSGHTFSVTVNSNNQ